MKSPASWYAHSKKRVCRFRCTTSSFGVVARQDDDSFGHATSDFPYDINLFVVNADQIPTVFEHLGPAATAGRYNVAYCMWEQEELPDAYRMAFSHLHEIWTATAFTTDAFSRKAPIPVRRVPYPVVPLQKPEDLDIRTRLGLPQEAFLFLYLFNYLSYFERKNPIAAVRAFRRAFGDDENKLLLIKTSQKDFSPADHQKLEAEVGTAKNIRLVNDYLSRQEVDALMLECGAYLSLHRSEGFGLTVAEAMACGKPVVSTTYSGPRDFFDQNNGYPVRFERIKLEKDEGPYPARQRMGRPRRRTRGRAAEAAGQRPGRPRKAGKKSPPRSRRALFPRGRRQKSGPAASTKFSSPAARTSARHADYCTSHRYVVRTIVQVDGLGCGRLLPVVRIRLIRGSRGGLAPDERGEHILVEKFEPTSQCGQKRGLLRLGAQDPAIGRVFHRDLRSLRRVPR